MPAVMSPWELNAHFGLLFGDAVPHPALAPVRQATVRFMRAWQALWAEHGDAAGGYEARALRLRQYVDEVSAPAQPLMLTNGLRWLDAMVVMMVRVALAPQSGPPAAGAGAPQREMGDNA